MFGKLKRLPWRHKYTHNSIHKPSHEQPGMDVSVDQVFSQQPGLVGRMEGKYGRKKIYGATVFLDHFIGFSYTHMEFSLNTEETLSSKNTLERFSKTNGITIQSYSEDNGRFTEKAFVDAVNDATQVLTFSGINSNHQNGIIERHIGLLTESVRTILLHTKQRWPEVISTILWPYAWKTAEFTSITLKYVGILMLQVIFMKTKESNYNITDYHTWGCPVFVLESQAQMKMDPKWNPRSRIGVYLVQSPKHSGNVALVLNPKTLHVSPQYHVVMDDEFTTVEEMRNIEIPKNWLDLVQNSSI